MARDEAYEEEKKDISPTIKLVPPTNMMGGLDDDDSESEDDDELQDVRYSHEISKRQKLQNVDLECF